MLRLFRLGALTLFFLTIAVGIVYFQLQTPPVTKDAVDEQIPIGGPFQLLDQDGTVRKNEDFKGKYMLVYFGYTYCPDICPMALQSISSALGKLKRDRDQIIPIFITVDPSRDTRESLKLYSGNFDKNILFLSGDSSATEQAMKGYRVFAAKSKNAQTTDYLMDHSTLIYLMDRQGKFLMHFPHTVDSDELADTLTKVLAQEKKI